MYYKLTMKDNRVVFVPMCEFPSTGDSLTFQLRLRVIQAKYPECVDWEMVEPDYVMTKCGHTGEDESPLDSEVGLSNKEVRE